VVAGGNELSVNELPVVGASVGDPPDESLPEDPPAFEVVPGIDVLAVVFEVGPGVDMVFEVPPGIDELFMVFEVPPGIDVLFMVFEVELGIDVVVVESGDID
jgi:hypothetical protein